MVTKNDISFSTRSTSSTTGISKKCTSLEKMGANLLNATASSVPFADEVVHRNVPGRRRYSIKFKTVID